MKLKCWFVFSAGGVSSPGGAEKSTGVSPREHTGWTGQKMWAGPHWETLGDLPHRVPEPSRRRQEWRCEFYCKMNVVYLCKSPLILLTTICLCVDLGRMYNLVSRITDGLGELKKLLETHIYNQGLAAIEKCGESALNVSVYEDGEDWWFSAYVRQEETVWLTW